MVLHRGRAVQAPTVLVVDDDEAVARAHAELLSGCGYEAVIETDPLKAEKHLLDNPRIALALYDLRMPGLHGLELLQRTRLVRPDVGVIIATVVGDIEEAVRATKLGAYNYLLKPIPAERLGRVLSSYFESLPQPAGVERSGARPAIDDDPRFRGFVTQSPVFKEVFRQIRVYGEADVPVLIHGETGTGKELVANLIHAFSPRRSERFISINVAALSTQLFESELFGHRRGAFTGAVADKAGFFEEAAGGTLFLDEIGELPFELQTKLLRVLQTKRFARVGDTAERPLDARLIFATNRHLDSDIGQERFRADLFFRIASHGIRLPPLRARREDIPLLTTYFLEKYCCQYGRHLDGIDKEAMDALEAYPFPGNVRELEGFISAAVLLEEASCIRLASLPFHVRTAATEPPAEDLESLRNQTILRVLAECDGNQTRAAERLGISRSTVIRALRHIRSATEE